MSRSRRQSKWQYPIRYNYNESDTVIIFTATETHKLVQINLIGRSGRKEL